MYIRLHVKYSDSCPTLMKVKFSWQIFEKYSNIKFHDNSSSESRDFPCGQTDGHEGDFRNFAKAPKERKLHMKDFQTTLGKF